VKSAGAPDMAVKPPERHWRSYGTEPLAPAGRGDDRADAGLSVVVPAHRVSSSG